MAREATKTEPEKSPAEQERLVLLKAVPDEKILDKLWESFADDILDTSKGVKEIMAHSVNGALALGAKVVEFTRDAGVQAQIALANHDKKGKPWKDYNWVATQLETAYSGMPTAKHLGDCARGYLRALETGQLKSGPANLRALLGWKPSAVPALTGKSLQDAGTPPLPKPPKGPADPADPPKDVDPRAELITALHDSNQSIQHWLDQCKDGGKATDIKEIQEMVAALMATLETV